MATQMPGERSLADVLRNMLVYGDLSFRDFMELALYHPEFGYYAGDRNPVGKAGDYVTAGSLSPAFSFAITGLFQEFVGRAEGEMCTFVDIGCGDGGLVRAVAGQASSLDHVRFCGVDRSLGRVSGSDPAVSFLQTLDEIPRDGLHFIFSNELFDAIPFARLVKRGEHLHELWVQEREGQLDWREHEAALLYDDYFAERSIELAEGQFADVALEWGAYYADVARFVSRGMIVTIDYGYRGRKLFHPRARRFGTAAAYVGHRVHRDLLAAPGEQDLTAHINFEDLEQAGARFETTTLFFDSLAKFLLSIGITGHELFKPAQDVEIASLEDGVAAIDARENARRLVLPEGIGEDLRVLVQTKNVSTEGWSLQRKLY